MTAPTKDHINILYAVEKLSDVNLEDLARLVEICLNAGSKGHVRIVKWNDVNVLIVWSGGDWTDEALAQAYGEYAD